jgi:hypothetical protein
LDESFTSQQILGRCKGIAGAVFTKASREVADSETTNEKGAKSTKPKTGQDENEAKEAILSGKKEDETSSKR